MSRYSVATYSRCGETFSIRLTTKVHCMDFSPTTDTWQWLLSFQHFKCSFCISGMFSKTVKTRVSHRVRMMTRWPGDPDVKDDPNDPLIRWPNDPVPCLAANAIYSKSQIELEYRRTQFVRVGQDSWSDERLTGAILLRDIYFYGGIVSAVFLCTTFFIFVYFK